MYIYFYSDKQPGDSRSFLILRKIVKEQKHQLMSNIWYSDTECPILTLDPERINDATIDVVIIEHAPATPALAYLVAYALSARRPLLYLIPKYEITHKYFDFLKHYKQKKPWVQMKYYLEATLTATIDKFLKDARSGKFERPCVKFTLRLTPTMSDYLRFTSIREDKTQANWLRALILEELHHDEVFRNRRK